MTKLFEAVDEVTLIEAGDLFKAMGNSTRIKILTILYDQEARGLDIAEKIDMTQSAVSHQLAVLKSARIIKGRRDGKDVYYGLADEHIKSVLTAIIEHVEEDG